MDYINQAPKEHKAMSAKFRKQFPTLKDLAESGLYLLQPKFDGVHGVAILRDDGGKMLSRDNKEYKSCDHILKELHVVFGHGVVIFGEIYKFDTPFKDISGMARRHNPEPTLMFVVYDAVPLMDFDTGHGAAPYEDRREYILTHMKTRPTGSSLVACPTYPGVGVDWQEYAQSLKDGGGYDGLIARLAKASWDPGACKEGEVIKVKPQITLDLRVVGVEEGKGKQAGMAGALIVEYKGVQSKVGTGMDDETRAMWWAYRQIVARGDVVFIIEVKCMEVTSANKLREPVYIARRYDKPQPD